MRIVFVLAVFAWVVGQSVVALAGASVGKAEPFELVKGPDGTIYKITAAQLEGIAKSEGPKPPCKIKDCYSILAFGKQRTVPVKALNAYIVSPDQAKALSGELMKIGKAPLEAKWEPPISISPPEHP